MCYDAPVEVKGQPGELIFHDRGSLCSLGCYGTHSGESAGFKSEISLPLQPVGICGVHYQHPVTPSLLNDVP